MGKRELKPKINHMKHSNAIFPGDLFLARSFDHLPGTLLIIFVYKTQRRYESRFHLYYQQNNECNKL